jgi:hypothetical protein
MKDVTGIDISITNGKIDDVQSDVTTIDGKIDTAQIDITAIKAETDKITQVAAGGLSDTEDSISYGIKELERHFHNNEKWFGKLAVPNGEINVAERVGGDTAPFVLTSGNSDFGAWVQILGSGDTPVASGKAKFDLHRYLVTETNDINPYIIQFASGESSGLAAKIAAEDFTESMYIAATNNNDSGIEELLDRRADAGEKIWARAACVGQNGKTIALYHAIHEYEG